MTHTNRDRRKQPRDQTTIIRFVTALTSKHLLVELLEIVGIRGAQEHHVFVRMESRQLLEARRLRTLQIEEM